MNMDRFWALAGALIISAFWGFSALADPSPVTKMNVLSAAPDSIPADIAPRHCPGPPPSEMDAARKNALLRYYPERARHQSMPGKVVLDCLVLSGGALSDCKVVSETPIDYGFAGAALKLTVLFRSKAPECSRVRVPINFKLPG